ncbi:MAG: glycosyltransferase family 2 protein [Desulfobacterales bacterium]|nr:glycosyltransferase family 2 protein [Desulfobacterales bacterium]
MYRNHSIALVIPAYNEARLIVPTLKSVPSEVDRIFVVDDCSTDGMDKVVLEMQKDDSRIHLIRHTINQGPGAGIISGYKSTINENLDIAVVVGGDNQMPLDEMYRFLDPIIDDYTDYAKGNRFMEKGNAFRDMPKLRLVGNTIISLMTKISSGYYHIFDVVDGYTAINKRALQLVDWDSAWKKYGYPMDFLMRLNVEGLRVIDIPRRAIYLPGERQSQIKGLHYAINVSPMLLKNFIHRMIFKYVFSNFHPLVFLFFFGAFFLVLGLGVGFYILFEKFFHDIIPSAGITSICALFISLGAQSTFFAMFFDMQEGMGYQRNFGNYLTDIRKINSNPDHRSKKNNINKES